MTTAYVLKVYPRFSETFIVTEILAREAAGERLRIYATRPTSDARFHPEIAMVQAPVTHLSHPIELPTPFESLLSLRASVPQLFERIQELLPVLERSDGRDIAQAVQIASRLRSDGVTHLHAHFATSAARVACIAAGLTGITWSVTTHAKDIFHEEVDPALLRALLTRAHKVIAISQYNYDYLLARFPELAGHVELVRNGLELDRFTYADPQPIEGPLKVCGVGRLVEKKGFDVLLRSVSEARARGTECDVRIAGDGGLLHELTHLANVLGVADCVTFLGPRSQSEIVRLLEWADVMAAPCVVGADGNADGLPTVLLEAMAKGVVVVSTRVTGIPEAIRGTIEEPETGILLEPGDHASLSDALVALASPSFPHRQVARSGRAYVEQEHDSAVQALKVQAVNR